ncbi:uncharacterized protein BDV17DRAFT_294264 [Aspergillus undulatus]|uniref:uncharacterized protein n=1 Tax=Aspergillus undulatus TaxID=1810928 RepID=UPI003CCC9B24
MRDMPSKFIEILDFKDPHPRISDSDVRLEDVLADHEAFVSRPVSSTQSKVSLDTARERVDRATPSPTPPSPTAPSPSQRWKRLSSIITNTRRPLYYEFFDECAPLLRLFRSLPYLPTTHHQPTCLTTLRDATNHDE